MALDYVYGNLVSRTVPNCSGSIGPAVDCIGVWSRHPKQRMNSRLTWNSRGEMTAEVF